MKDQCRKAWMLLFLSAGLLAAPGAAFGAAGPASVVTPPASVIVLQGAAANFTVVGDGTVPLTYHWLRGGAPIVGANASTYTIPVTTAGDSGAQFSVIVSNSLGTATSATATLLIDPGTLVTTPVTLVNLSSQNWRYFTNGTDQGTAWRDVGFNDSSWQLGQALFGFETTPANYAETFRTTFTAYSQSVTTYYYRAHFNYTPPAGNLAGAQFTITAYADDGVVIYVNGVEAGRARVPADQTVATFGTDQGAEGTADTFTLPVSSLVAGDNVVAAEVHQATAASSDTTFGLGITGFVTNRIADTAAPVVVSLSPSAGSIVNHLNSIEILFSEAVQGVDASDLLINGVPATEVLFGVPGQLVFNFATPANTGTVTVAWAPGHGIKDLAATPNNFVPTGPWNYTYDPNSSPAAFIISEFLAKNETGLRDENGDRSDWIEIRNPGLIQGNLQGWFLTDDPFNLAKWRFPYEVLEPGKYMLVYASGKDRTNRINGTIFTNLHSSFLLNSDGGFLALVNPNTNIISTFGPSYPQQSADISYGRDTADPNITGFYQTPTPRAQNSATGAGIAPEVQFSVSSRTFLSNAPFSLTLSTPGVAGTSIYYTTGTNVPSTSSTLYTGPINISVTTILRARSFAPNKLPGPVSTKSYIALSPATAANGYSTNLVTFNSAIPILVLHNYGQGTVPANSDAEQHVIFQVFDNDGGRSSMTNLPNLTGRAVFHARGSSTLVASSGKSSFFFEVRDEVNNDLPVSLMGLPAESDWVLYAPNAFEPAIMHNPLAHAWYRDLDRYGSRTRFFELYLQDDAVPGGPIIPTDYHGIYVLEEKIKRDKNRVDIERLDVEDVSPDTITGGYLLSIDRADTGKPTLSAGGGTFNYLEPNGDEMGNALRAPQVAYIRDYLNAFNTALNGVNWTNPITGYNAYVDTPSWVDLHIHEVITFNVDAMRLSGYFYKDRNKKIVYGPTWDYDRTQGSTDGRDANPRTWRSQTGDLGTDFFGFTPWWNRLLSAPDFWQAWVDRYQELRSGTNVLTTNGINAHIQRFYDQLAEAYPRDSNRWSRVPRGAGGSGSGTFATETQWKRNWYSNRCDFADGQFVAKPGVSLIPGPLAGTTVITVTPAVGLGDKTGSPQLILSLDGLDPRLSGGAIRTGPNVLSNTGPITITVSNNIRLFARSRNTAHVQLTGANNPPTTTPWSGPVVGTYYFPTSTPPLRITEIMYHPPPAPIGNTNDADNFEYLEFKNISGSSLNVTGYRLRGGIEFDFPNLTLLGGQSCVVVSDVAAFQSRYGGGAIIAGAYTNKPSQQRLGNDGDHIKLEGSLYEPILDFDYKDSWYPTTDGAGFALQIVDENLPTSAWGTNTSWRPSGAISGTPGGSDPGPVTVAPVYINEILTHTDPPAQDAIELFNPNGATVNVGGWYLTDDFGTPKKFRLANGTTIGANGYFVLYATNAIGSNAFGGAFSLSSKGDEIYLFSGDPTNNNLTGFVIGFDFGAQANGVTFGRHVISTGGAQYPAQAAPSLGSANGLPKTGPIVISEIMYHPTDISTVEGPHDNNRDEFVELENITGVNQPLYDPAFPTNTWRLRDAVSYRFPTNVVIPPSGHVLVVSFDPVADPVAASQFRLRNNVFQGAPLFGPYEGQLDNSGDSVELVRPDVPQPANALDANAVYYILADKVNYSQNPPWPTGADGFGFSLQRLAPGGYGNDPANWTADLKTAGYGYNAGGGPVFTQHPQPTTVLGTYNATLSVTATGAPPIFYQWFYNNTTPLPNATGPVLVLSNVVVSQQGNYRCQAQNEAGVTFSSNAFLTVLIPVAISQQPTNVFLRVPPDPAANPTNRVAVFRVVASSSTPITYRWRINGTNVPSDDPNISGVTSNTLTISNVTMQSVGYLSCVLTDANGPVFTTDAALGVTPYLIQMSSPLTVAAGADISLFAVVQAWPPPYYFKWSRATPVITNVLTTDTTNFITFNSTSSGYVLAPGVLSNSLPLRLVFTNLATYAQVNGASFLNASAYISVLADTDGDGIPDLVETALSLNPSNALDGAFDLDGDGVSNAKEYASGTNPNDASSYLRIVEQTAVPGLASIKFAFVSNRTYTVQYTDTITAQNWSRLADMLSRTTNGVELIPDPGWTTNRFYRVVTPRAP